jgi:LemA protein
MADLRIPDDKASEVFELAARLYVRQNQSYTVEELMQAGSAGSIPPEFIQRALTQLQAREEEVIELRARAQQHRQLVTLGSLIAGAIVLSWGIVTYYRLSLKAQRVEMAWAQVEHQFQRQADLIPSVINVTLSAANQDQSLVTQLTQARQTYETAVGRQEQVAAAGQVQQALAQFQTAVLTLPQAQTNPLYATLQNELAGSETRITVEQMHYNEVVGQYNQQVQTLPNALVARLSGFAPQPLLEAYPTAGLSIAPMGTRPD